MSMWPTMGTGYPRRILGNSTIWIQIQGLKWPFQPSHFNPLDSDAALNAAWAAWPRSARVAVPSRWAPGAVQVRATRDALRAELDWVRCFSFHFERSPQGVKLCPRFVISRLLCRSRLSSLHSPHSTLLLSLSSPLSLWLLVSRAESSKRVFYYFLAGEAEKHNSTLATSCGRKDMTNPV